MTAIRGDQYVRQAFSFLDSFPENASVIEVLNSRGNWIEARFVVLQGGAWQLEFAADDICPADEALEFFSTWRNHIVVPMTLKEITKT